MAIFGKFACVPRVVHLTITITMIPSFQPRSAHAQLGALQVPSFQVAAQLALSIQVAAGQKLKRNETLNLLEFLVRPAVELAGLDSSGA